MFSALVGATFLTTHCAVCGCRLDCPAFRVPADLVLKHDKLVFAALDALRPAQPLQAIIDRQDMLLSMLRVMCKTLCGLLPFWRSLLLQTP